MQIAEGRALGVESTCHGYFRDNTEVSVAGAKETRRRDESATPGMMRSQWKPSNLYIIYCPLNFTYVKTRG